VSDDFPVGTIAGRGREVRPFFGLVSQIPDGWVLAFGQTIPPDKHDHPGKRGQPWTVVDLSREMITGASTHLSSDSMNDEGQIANVRADNQDVPGIYPLVKVRDN
jgi:hypothetical protein